MSQDHEDATGDRIHAARKRKGMSQQDLAEAVGVVRKTIQRYELGQGSPDGRRIRDIAKVLDVSPAWLLTGSDQGAAEAPSRPSAYIEPARESAPPPGPELGADVSLVASHLLTEVRDDAGLALAVVVQVFVRKTTRRVDLSSSVRAAA